MPSSTFIDLLSQSHTAVSACEVISPDGNTVVNLVVDGGSVSVDRSRLLRRAASVRGPAFDTEGRRLVPVDSFVGQERIEKYGESSDKFGNAGDVYGAFTRTVLSSLVAPYGTTFRPWRGIVFPSGSIEWVSLGVFLVEEATFEEIDGVMSLELAGPDVAQRFVDARWPEPYQVERGEPYGQAIEQMLEERVPGFDYDIMPTTATSPNLVLGDEQDTDPWREASRMAESFGGELFLSADGTVTVAPEPDEDTPVSWEFVEGSRCTVSELSRRLSRRDTFNGIVVSGDSTGSDYPIRAEVFDENPDSPTFRGTFGDKPRFFSSSYIRTQAQAQDYANAQLLKRLGLDEQVIITSVPVPQLDAGQAVTVRRKRSGLDAKFIIEKVDIPLSADGEMTVECRRARKLGT